MLVFDSFGQIGTWRRWKCDPKLSWYESMMGQDQLCQKFRKCHHLGPRYDFFYKQISNLLCTRQSNICSARFYSPKLNWSLNPTPWAFFVDDGHFSVGNADCNPCGALWNMLHSQDIVCTSVHIQWNGQIDKLTVQCAFAISLSLHKRSKENDRIDERRHQGNCFSLVIIRTSFNWNVPNNSWHCESQKELQTYTV